MNFPLKIRDIQKISKKNSISISAFGYENKEKHPIYVSKNVMKKNMLVYYWKQKKAKYTMFLLKILILSCMIMLYILEESIFTIIAYKL